MNITADTLKGWALLVSALAGLLTGIGALVGTMRQSAKVDRNSTQIGAASTFLNAQFSSNYVSEVQKANAPAGAQQKE